MFTNEISSVHRIVIVTNIPAPYRIPIYQRLAAKLGYNNFHVIFCSQKEDNREWISNRAILHIPFLSKIT